jgi:GH15 family glucan-1,4-alpha-glucosidase
MGSTDTPIAALGFLSDCRSAALVTDRGSVDWLCFPSFDSPSVFGALLDDTAGHWSIRPQGDFKSSRRYLDRTLVLETTCDTATGRIMLVDTLAMGPNSQGHALGRNVPHLLVRGVSCVDGQVDIEVHYEPRPEYGIITPLLSHVDGGVTARGGAEWRCCPRRSP